MPARSWLIFTALAASLLAPAAGASPAEEGGTTSDHGPATSASLNMVAAHELDLYATSSELASTASDSLNRAAPDGLNLHRAPSAGGRIDNRDSGRTLTPYIIGGGILAGIAITQIDFGWEREIDRSGNDPLSGAPVWPTIGPEPPTGEPVTGTGPPSWIGGPRPGPVPVSVDSPIPEPGVPLLVGAAFLGLLGLRAMRIR